MLLVNRAGCSERGEMPTQDPWWLRDELIVGFEDGEDEGSEEGSESEDDPGEEEETSDEPGEDEGDEGDESEGKESESKSDDTESLKSALRKERMARKRLEREVKRLSAATSNGSEDKEEETKPEVDAERNNREKRLAQKLQKAAVDNLIIKHAGEFKDANEALALINRTVIEVDQDDDDPSEIEVDEDSVIDAVKALAKKSPHLLLTKEDRKVRSGSSFSKSRRKGSEPSDEELKRKYRALNR
jgi:hypothetical protein